MRACNMFLEIYTRSLSARIKELFWRTVTMFCSTAKQGILTTHCINGTSMELQQEYNVDEQVLLPSILFVAMTIPRHFDTLKVVM